MYELEGLVCDLFMESGEAFDGKVITLHNAMEILSTTVFDYNSGTRFVVFYSHLNREYKS